VDREEARQRLDQAIRDMSQASREHAEDAPGVVNAWVLVTAERYALDDGWGSTVRIVPPDDQSDWQTAGLLYAAMRLQDESWRMEGTSDDPD
jgi:hypothetical protein